MTDRINSITVVLDKDYREDDAQPILDAIGMIQCVISVKGNVSNIESHMAEQRARQHYQKKIWEVFNAEK